MLIRAGMGHLYRVTVEAAPAPMQPCDCDTGRLRTPDVVGTRLLAPPWKVLKGNPGVSKKLFYFLINPFQTLCTYSS